MSSIKSSFLSGLRLELPYLIDALAKDHGFLSNPAQFDFLGEVIVDHLRHNEEPPSKYLVAACDSGIDAYSTCICLLEAIRLQQDFSFTILGTEFLPANLEQAMRGIYPADTISGLSSQICKRYFFRSKDSSRDLVRPKPGVRHHIHFRHQGIFESFSLREPMDVIVCRQILHHFHPELSKALAAHLRSYLAPGGFLMLGAPGVTLPDFRHLTLGIYQAI